MATTEVKRYEATTLDELAEAGQTEGRLSMRVRRHFDIGAFGVNARRAEQEGVQIVSEHDETGPMSGGHEELYVVLSGHATFTVDGEEVDAPAGTLLFVRDTATKRGAVAREAGTEVLIVGGKPGQAFTESPWETVSEMWPIYQAGEYDKALEILRRGEERLPGNPGILYNIACMEALTGQTEQAFAHLGRAVESEYFRKHAKTDDDLASLRSDPRFAELVGPIEDEDGKETE
jgi:hypothetical protein